MTDQFIKEIPVAITVSDKDGKIVFMNDKSEKIFEKYGGRDLLNKNLNDYHNENSRSIISKMLQDKSTNAYTIEKNGIKKMIFQSPWLADGEVMGMIEFSFEIPENMSHFIRG